MSLIQSDTRRRRGFTLHALIIEDDFDAHIIVAITALLFGAIRHGQARVAIPRTVFADLTSACQQVGM